MIINQHKTAFNRALSRLRETPLTSFLTITVIAIALTLPIGLNVVLQNFKSVTPLINHTRQITLYLQNGVTNTRASELANQIKTNQYVAQVKFISAQNGLNQLKENAGLSKALDLLDKNPLPAVVVVNPKANLKTVYDLTPLLNQLKSFPEVKSTVLDTVWLERLQHILQVVSYIEMVLFILFALAVFIIVVNTIRLNLQSSEQEIAILKLVGATKSFISLQFIYLGFLYGILSALGTWFIVSVIVHTLNIPIARLANTYNSDFALQGMTFHNVMMLLMIGSLLGIGGALLSSYEHFKKHG